MKSALAGIVTPTVLVVLFLLGIVSALFGLGDPDTSFGPGTYPLNSGSRTDLTPGYYTAHGNCQVTTLSADGYQQRSSVSVPDGWMYSAPTPSWGNLDQFVRVPEGCTLVRERELRHNGDSYARTFDSKVITDMEGH